MKINTNRTVQLRIKLYWQNENFIIIKNFSIIYTFKLFFFYFEIEKLYGVRSLTFAFSLWIMLPLENKNLPVMVTMRRLQSKTKLCNRLNAIFHRIRGCTTIFITIISKWQHYQWLSI